MVTAGRLLRCNFFLPAQCTILKYWPFSCFLLCVLQMEQVTCMILERLVHDSFFHQVYCIGDTKIKKTLI